MIILMAIIGFITTGAIMIWIFCWGLFYTKELLQDWRYDKLAGMWKSSTEQIDHWCRNEFPQVAYLAREINQALKDGHTINAEELRKKLREGKINP